MFFVSQIREQFFMIKKKEKSLVETIDKYFANNYLINIEKPSGVQYFLHNLICVNHYLNNNMNNSSNTFLERYNMLFKLNSYTA